MSKNTRVVSVFTVFGSKLKRKNVIIDLFSYHSELGVQRVKFVKLQIMNVSKLKLCEYQVCLFFSGVVFHISLN